MTRWGILGRGLLVALGLSIAGECAHGQVQGRDFELGPCAGGRGGAPAECGRLTVFENRAARSGRRIDIHFMVIRADQPGVRRAVFLFAGGPGQGSTMMAPLANGWARPLRATQDIVMVDQRGTGRSHPLHCPFNREADPAAAFGHVFDPDVLYPVSNVVVIATTRGFEFI